MPGWLLVQAALFQGVWFTSVLGQNQWLILGLAILAAHFALSPSRRDDAGVLLLVVVGLSLDSLLTLVGLFDFSEFPYWLAVLWIAFVLTLGHSLKWLRQLHPLWQAMVGAMTGTLSYFAGYQLEAVTFPHGVLLSCIVLSVVWAILLPVLVGADRMIRHDDALQ